jgi:hypothetical protein
MSQVEQSPVRNSSRPCAFVRFTPEQYARLLRDQLEFGKTVPELLRTVYFQRGHPRPLFDAATAKFFRREMGYQGNNVNQLVRRANSGIVDGAADEIAALVREYQKLRALLSGAYGDR